MPSSPVSLLILPVSREPSCACSLGRGHGPPVLHWALSGAPARPASRLSPRAPACLPGADLPSPPPKLPSNVVTCFPIGLPTCCHVPSLEIRAQRLPTSLPGDPCGHAVGAHTSEGMNDQVARSLPSGDPDGPSWPSLPSRQSNGDGTTSETSDPNGQEGPLHRDPADTSAAVLGRSSWGDRAGGSPQAVSWLRRPSGASVGRPHRDATSSKPDVSCLWTKRSWDLWWPVGLPAQRMCSHKLFYM